MKEQPKEEANRFGHPNFPLALQVFKQAKEFSQRNCTKEFVSERILGWINWLESGMAANHPQRSNDVSILPFTDKVKFQ